MNQFTIFLLLCCCLTVLLFSPCDAAGGVQVEYSTTNCKCRGIELRSSGKGPRTISVKCTKTDKGTKGDVTCQYKGNPHGCAKYNNNGQEKFYKQALDDVGPRICTLPAGNMICPKGQIVTKICGDLGDKNLRYESGP